MKKLKLVLAISITTIALISSEPAFAINKCIDLPATIEVKPRSAQCGKVPTVVLSGKSRSVFSAAFRWDDNTATGQDRSPFALDNSSASSSPYKTQRRVAKGKKTYLCYGKFINRAGYPLPVQLTVKPSAAPSVKRYCVDF